MASQKENYYDFHCHSAQSEEGVTKLVSLEIDRLPEPDDKQKDVYYSLQLHPWFIGPRDKKVDKRVFALAESPLVSVIGEIGLDRHRGVDFELQERFFLTMLDLAREIKKNVVIHSVHTTQDVIKAKRQYPEIKRWLLHGFHSSKPEVLKSYLENGFTVSLHPETLCSTDIIRFILSRQKYLEQIALESDDMPASMPMIEMCYETLAKALYMRMDKIKEAMGKSFRDFIKVGK